MASQRARLLIIAAEAGVATRARAIWLRHPMLKSLSAEAACHFDRAPLCSGGAPLLHCALRSAVSWFDRVAGMDEGRPDTPSAHYVAALLHVLSHGLFYRISLGGVPWDCASQPWHRFSASSPSGHAPASIQAPPASPTRAERIEAFRAICACFSAEAGEVLPLIKQMTFLPLTPPR